MSGDSRKRQARPHERSWTAHTRTRSRDRLLGEPRQLGDRLPAPTPARTCPRAAGIRATFLQPCGQTRGVLSVEPVDGTSQGQSLLPDVTEDVTEDHDRSPITWVGPECGPCPPERGRRGHSPGTPGPPAAAGGAGRALPQHRQTPGFPLLVSEPCSVPPTLAQAPAPRWAAGLGRSRRLLAEAAQQTGGMSRLGLRRSRLSGDHRGLLRWVCEDVQEFSAAPGLPQARTRESSACSAQL